MISLLTFFYKLWFIVAGIGGISILVFLHELGHFLFCKLFNVYTPTFSIGFGPVLWSTHIGTTKFTFCAIPLGGYVEIAGMAEEQQNKESQPQHLATESLFSDKPYYQKFLIMMGGILFNILFAYKVALMMYLVGAPGSPILYIETATTTIARVLPDTVAAQQGLQEGDIITAINGITLEGRAQPLITHLKTTQEPVIISFKREGNTYITEPITVVHGKPFGILLKTVSLQPLGFLESISRAWYTTIRWIRDTTYGLLHIVKKADFSSAGGPVKIISMISNSASDGILMYLLLLALISINLAIFNLLPVPILDGGQLLLVTLETLIGHKLPHKAREYLFIGTWLVFLGLIIVLSFNDIAQLAKPYFASIKQCLSLSTNSY